MVEANCYHCGSGQQAFYATENGYELVKCKQCGLLYVSPRPEQGEIDRAHTFGVHQGESLLRATGEFCEPRVNTYYAVLRDLYGMELARKQRRWLDIGCGHGEFLKAIHDFSKGKVVATGVEPNVHKQESARLRGLDVSYFDLQTHDEQYDCISLLNVFSHLPNPPEFFRQCKQVLKIRGELLLETGDTANLSADEHPRPFYLPDHLSFGSQEIVTNILEHCGFEIVAIEKYPAFPFRPGYVGFGKELIKVVWPNRKSEIREYIRRYALSKKYMTDVYIRAVLTT